MKNTSNLKILILIIGLALTFTSFAQTAQLDITGSAQINHKPTECKVTFSVELKNASYTTVITDLTTDINGLVSSLKKQGFAPAEIITQQFNISKSKKYVNNAWKEDGFMATQQLSVVFPIDQKRLIKVLNASTGTGSNPNISIGFQIDQATQESITNSLIKSAVKDARSKADLIANTAGYEVSEIKSIQYGSSRSTSQPQPMYRMAESKAASFSSDFGPMEAESMNFSDQVHIVFGLKEKG
ncbi:MAG: hypothetical protein ACJAZM_001013 [Cyclobacteriaceae bacterium]|jgi:uncharacterized protein YggE